MLQQKLVLNKMNVSDILRGSTSHHLEKSTMQMPADTCQCLEPPCPDAHVPD